MDDNGFTLDEIRRMAAEIGMTGSRMNMCSSFCARRRWRGRGGRRCRSRTSGRPTSRLTCFAFLPHPYPFSRREKGTNCLLSPPGREGGSEGWTLPGSL